MIFLLWCGSTITEARPTSEPVPAVVGFAAGLADWPLLVEAAVLSILLLMLPEPLQGRERSKDAPAADKGC